MTAGLAGAGFLAQDLYRNKGQSLLAAGPGKSVRYVHGRARTIAHNSTELAKRAFYKVMVLFDKEKTRVNQAQKAYEKTFKLYNDLPSDADPDKRVRYARTVLAGKEELERAKASTEYLKDRKELRSKRLWTPDAERPFEGLARPGAPDRLKGSLFADRYHGGYTENELTPKHPEYINPTNLVNTSRYNEELGKFAEQIAKTKGKIDSGFSLSDFRRNAMTKNSTVNYPDWEDKTSGDEKEDGDGEEKENGDGDDEKKDKENEGGSQRTSPALVDGGDDTGMGA